MRLGQRPTPGRGRDQPCEVVGVKSLTARMWICCCCCLLPFPADPAVQPARQLCPGHQHLLGLCDRLPRKPTHGYPSAVRQHGHGEQHMRLPGTLVGVMTGHATCAAPVVTLCSPPHCDVLCCAVCLPQQAITMGMMLAAEPAEPDIMNRPPRRPGKRLLGKLILWRCAFVSGLLVILVLGVYGECQHQTLDRPSNQSCSFRDGQDFSGLSRMERRVPSVAVGRRVQRHTARGTLVASVAPSQASSLRSAPPRQCLAAAARLGLCACVLSVLRELLGCCVARVCRLGPGAGLLCRHPACRGVQHVGVW